MSIGNPNNDLSQEQRERIKKGIKSLPFYKKREKEWKEYWWNAFIGFLILFAIYAFNLFLQQSGWVK